MVILTTIKKSRWVAEIDFNNLTAKWRIKHAQQVV